MGTSFLALRLDHATRSRRAEGAARANYVVRESRPAKRASEAQSPVHEGDEPQTARVVKRTRSLGLLECDVVDEGGSLVARVYSTCMVLRGEDAKGR
jgi:hypothetical protein